MSNDKKTTILILDDEEYIVENLCEYFENYEFNVHSKTCGSGGLEIVKNEAIDLAIVDLRLTDMTGNEFIVQALKVKPHLKFIIHTGSIDYTTPDELIERGITDNNILYKPVIGLQPFMDKVNELLIK
ncbi:MAG: response regulator [Spirochaetes bacterium]|nr:response regulator [Spirochaetota bacterium]